MSRNVPWNNHNIMILEIAIGFRKNNCNSVKVRIKKIWYVVHVVHMLLYVVKKLYAKQDIGGLFKMNIVFCLSVGQKTLF